MTNKSNIGRKFRLIGCTLEFTVVHEKLVAGFIPAITGHSADGRRTQPRVKDVLFLDGVA